MRAPRWLRRRRASLGGYFWLPCPICGEYFGGYERPHGAVYASADATSGWMYCAPCYRAFGPTLVRPKSGGSES